MLLVGLILFATISAPIEQTLDAIGKARTEGRTTDALAQLETLKENHPTEFELNGLGYLEGVLRLEASQLGRAEGIFRGIEPDTPLLRPNLLLRLLQVTEKADFETRKALFEQFLGESRRHPRWTSVAYQYARALERSGDRNLALQWYDRVWSAKAGTLSRRAALKHALFHVEAGQKSEAIRDLDRILSKGERDDVALQAAKKLGELQPASQATEAASRVRSRVFLNNGETKQARAYLEHLVSTYPSSLSRDQYAYQLGRSYVVEGRFQKAVEAYESAYEKFPKATWGIYSKYLVANTALRMQDYERAAVGYEYIIDHHPESRYAPNAHYNLADTQLWLGKEELALKTAKLGLATSPSSEKPRFRYYLARHFVEERDPEKALGYLNQLDHLSSRKLPSGVTREEIYFFKGLCLSWQDKAKEAQAAFREAALGRPNYFAFLAREEIAALGGDLKHDKPVEDWSDRILEPRPIHSTIEQRSDFAARTNGRSRIRELLFLRLYDEAALEMQRQGKSAFGGSSVDQLLNVAYFALIGNQPQASIRAAELLQSQTFPTSMPEAYPALLRELLYPRHYWELVRRASSTHEIDPELILSLVRQESRFQADAKSVAAARGLMQIMLPTARQLSAELEMEQPVAADLYRPEVSIALGTFYLKKLIDQFDGSMEKALAAYNGGVENVERWASKVPGAPAHSFVANIGFRETKLYVLKVLGNYYAYRVIYSAADGESKVAAGQR